MKIIATLFLTVIAALLASANPLAIAIVEEDGKNEATFYAAKKAAENCVAIIGTASGTLHE